MSTHLPFKFRKRVELAAIYLQDGALLTCAARLESLAADIRKHQELENKIMDDMIAANAEQVTA